MISEQLLDKDKCYCYKCLKEDKIESLSFDKNENKFKRCNNKSHIRNNITFRYSKKSNKWLTYHGYAKEAISLSKANRKTAKYCKEHGLGFNNPKIHQKAIQTQIKNGTFNMLNPEFSKKHHQKMIDNKTGIFSEENQKYIRSHEVGIKRAKNANTNEKQLKRVQKQLNNGNHVSQIKLKEKMEKSLNSIGINIKNLNYFEIKKLFINKSPLNINGKIIDFENLKIYNNRCGAIGLTGINIKDGNRYALNAGKSINIGNEIRKFYMITSQPEKQDPNYDYGRWYKIANEYRDFEIILLCIDVPEEEALLYEANWAFKNNAEFKYFINDRCEKIQKENTHGYWML